MALAHVETLEGYARNLEGHADEVQALYQDCLITVTSFFRDPDTYKVLCQEVLPRLVKDRPPGVPVRVWVPGCATGEQVGHPRRVVHVALAARHVSGRTSRSRERVRSGPPARARPASSTRPSPPSRRGCSRLIEPLRQCRQLARARTEGPDLVRRAPTGRDPDASTHRPRVDIQTRAALYTADPYPPPLGGGAWSRIVLPKSRRRANPSPRPGRRNTGCSSGSGSN